MASTRSARNTKRNRATDEGEDLQVDERAPANEDCPTPSARFNGPANHIQDTATTEQPMDIGWKMYSLEEKNMKMKLHVDFLKTCLEEDIISKG